MSEREPGSTVDLAVIGGGIYGCMLLEQARQRGLVAALLERDTLGSGVSGNNYRTLHGGLRSLQTGDLGRFFEGVRERRGFLENYPDYCSVEQFVLPLSGAGLERGWIARCAASLNNQLSAGRNQGIRRHLALPATHYLSAAAARPFLAGTDLTANAGALSWYDGRLDNPAALFAHLADVFSQRGSSVSVIERACVESVTRRADGYDLQFVSTEAESEEQPARSQPMRARRVVDATGVWHSPWFAGLGFQRRYSPSLAWNILYEHDALSDAALGIRLESGQTVFLKNLNGRLYVGTGHAPLAAAPAKQSPLAPLAEPLVDAFAQMVSRATGLPLGPGAIRETQIGVLPVVAGSALKLAVRPALSWDNAGGAVHVTGVKFTTAPGVARRVLNQLRF